MPLDTARAAATLNLHGDVGAEITAATVAPFLKANAGRNILLSVHSYGGDALAGIAIHNMVARHNGHKTIVVEGIAASAASLIAMAGDTIVMPSNAFLMIHNASGLSYGTAEDARETAGILDNISAAYRRTYAAKTGLPEDEIVALMDAETWLTADEAVAKGFATETAPPAEIRMDARRISSFVNPPPELRAAVAPAASPTAPAMDPAPSSNREHMTRLAAIAARHGLGQEFQTMSEQTNNPQALQDQIVDAIAAQAPQASVLPVARSGYDQRVAMRGAMAEALAARVAGAAPSAAAQPFMGASLVELARECVANAGQRVGRFDPASRVIEMAISTSDFPLLLQDTSRRLLQSALAAAPGAARTICMMTETPDFRPGRFLQAAGLQSLEQMAEGANVQYSAPAERGETYQMKTYGKAVRFTRQAMINDDLNAFNTTRMISNAITATEAEAFVAMFTANGTGWGPTLSDNKPMWHADHGNTSAGTVSTSGISAGRIVMRGQRDLVGNLVAPEPRIVLVGPAGETAAEQALTDISVVATGEGDRPIFANRLRVVVEPRLSGTAWFLMADPSVMPMIAMVTLAGSGGQPQLSTHETGDFDGISIRVLHDFVIAPMTHVGGVRMTGA